MTACKQNKPTDQASHTHPQNTNSHQLTIRSLPNLSQPNHQFMKNALYSNKTSQNITTNYQKPNQQIESSQNQSQNKQKYQQQKQLQKIQPTIKQPSLKQPSKHNSPNQSSQSSTTSINAKQPPSVQQHQQLTHDTPPNTDIFSAISFSRFADIDKPSFADIPEIEQNQTSNKSIKIPEPQPIKQPTITKISSHTKIISVKKILQSPISTASFNQQQQCFPKTLKSVCIFNQQCTFHYQQLSQSQLLQRINKFTITKKMRIKSTNQHLLILEQIPLYRLAINLCLPTPIEHEVYQLTCPEPAIATLVQLEGDDKKFREFTQEFMLSLWIDEVLECVGLQENLKYFVKFANQYLRNSEKKRKDSPSCGKIDQLKSSIENALINLSLQKQQYISQHQNFPHLSHLLTQIITTYNTGQLLLLKQSLKHLQTNLKSLLHQRMTSSKTPSHNHNQSKLTISQFIFTPSVQRLMLAVFYNQLQLCNKIKKYMIGDKILSNFQKKKYFIKNTLTCSDIFTHLQISELYNIVSAAQNKQIVFVQSIKILSSLKPITYPSPSEIAEIACIFKNNLMKEINVAEQNSMVKFPDYSNDEKILLQLFIYALIMCENKEIYSAIETARVFYYSSQDNARFLQEDPITILNLLKVIKTICLERHFIYFELMGAMTFIYLITFCTDNYITIFFQLTVFIINCEPFLRLFYPKQAKKLMTPIELQLFFQLFYLIQTTILNDLLNL